MMYLESQRVAAGPDEMRNNAAWEQRAAAGRRVVADEASRDLPILAETSVNRSIRGVGRLSGLELDETFATLLKVIRVVLDLALAVKSSGHGRRLV